MSTLQKSRPISVEEYLEGEKYSDIKHEFAGGEVRAMVGTSEAHNLIAGAFYMALRRHLGGSACRVFMVDMKVRVGDDFYYPDAFVTRDKADTGPYFWDVAVYAGTMAVELTSVELSISLDEIYGDVLP